jgi:hypothetical protein
MNKHIFRISKFFRYGNGGGISQNLVEIALSDYAYPYSFEDAWENAIDRARDSIDYENLSELHSVTVSYEGDVNE